MPLHRESLPFEKKNQLMTRLPKYARVSKRPIPHPPTANPYAGSSVPKTVYVSTKTPFMSAVKRVMKLLHHVEKRALDASGPRSSENQEKKGKGAEEIFVKATGRAIEKALSVGRWFERDQDKFCVRVTTGTVLVVDDVEEDEGLKKRIVEEGERLQKQQPGADKSEQGESQEHSGGIGATSSLPLSTPSSSTPGVSKSASKKRKRAANAVTSDELPETRTRWVNMVEIAVSLK